MKEMDFFPSVFKNDSSENFTEICFSPRAVLQVTILLI